MLLPCSPTSGTLTLNRRFGSMQDWMVMAMVAVRVEPRWFLQVTE